MTPLASTRTYKDIVSHCLKRAQQVERMVVPNGLAGLQAPGPTGNWIEFEWNSTSLNIGESFHHNCPWTVYYLERNH